MVFGLQKLQDELFCMTEERNYFQGKYLEQVSEIAALKDDLRKARREILKLRGELMETSSNSLLGMFAGDDSSFQLHVDGNNSNNFQTPPKNNRRRSRRSTTGGGGGLVPAALAENHQEEKKETDLEDDGTGSNSSSGGRQQRNLPATGAADERGQILDNGDDDDERLRRGEDDIEYDDDDDNDDDDDHGDEDTEAADIRQSAEKLLQWASYRSYARTSSTNSPVDQGSINSPVDQGSVSSGRSSLGGGGGQGQGQQVPSSSSLLGPMIPRTIDSTSLKNSMSQGSLVVEAAAPEAETRQTPKAAEIVEAN